VTPGRAVDAVVIGAGVIGASCAAYLARAGLRVVVIDRAAGPDAGDGSTARATGGFRASFATPINVALSRLARTELARFADDTGVDPGFARVGYLWLAGTDAELAALARAADVQRAAGEHDVALVGADDIARINPAAARDRIAGAAWCPSDGTIRPTEIRRGYLALAGRRGVDVRWNAPVVALERAGGRIAAVVTPDTRIATDLVIDAAGAWAAPVAAFAGVEVPVVPLRQQVAVTVPTDVVPATAPLTIWIGDGFHGRVRDGRVLLLMPSPADPADSWSTSVEPAWLDAIARIAAERIPALASVPLDRARAWAGLYELSPDRHALLGLAPGCANFILANGSSGHGVMHAPALGLLIAELATGGARSLDVRALRPSRFADGEPIRGDELL
jgi:sarcosine oxidase subunit beta